jgi:chaperonin cofactor prefoldin
MKKYREFREYSDHLTKRLNNLKRDNKQSMKDFKALKNKYEDMFNDFLHNGVKKH